MQLDYDEQRYPGLGAFRRACRDQRVDVMASIVATEPSWYADENPDELTLERLSRVFQAQHYASENDTNSLRLLLIAQPWVVSHPWTTQRWLPLSQAAFAGHRPAVEMLLERGADPSMLVGGPGEQSTVAELARFAGHEELARWIESLAP